MLTFDEAAHVYHWEGKPVPNVTRIIAPLTDYSRIPPDALERARQQGQAVHKMVELDCKDDLDVAQLPEWMRGHLDAWRNFQAETGFECYSSEQKVYHPRLRYAGTLDLAGKLPKLKGQRAAQCVIDVKRSFYAGPAIGLQLAAYLDAANAMPKLFPEEICGRFALQLNPNGTYRLQPFADRDDHAAFLACLQQLRWKEKHYGPG